MKQRGLTFLAGAQLGGPAWFAPVGDDVRVALTGAHDDADRVRDALRLAGSAGLTLVLLSYEACVALDPRLPRHAREPSLGPDVLVRRLRPVRAEQGEAREVRSPAIAPAPDAQGRHIARVRAAREHLLDGVIYQANLAHRLTVEPTGYDDGLAFFVSRVRERAPPCAAFVDIPGWGSLISLSPERFVSVAADDGARVARTFPIKGTRPRGATVLEDARLRAELCASEKDAAEHVMIVDLLRNDLGKVAVPGGVTVERLLEVLSVKNVHHLETTIAARVGADVSVAAVLEATVPGGSITGAPKSSAVEVIHALEDGPRGLYTGVLALIDGATLKSSLLIRTWLRPDDGPGALHVGGGIVVDSDPEAEWQETLDKAAAFR